MNKRYILEILTITILIYFMSAIDSKVDIANKNFTTLSQQSTKQSENIAKNENNTDQLLKKLTNLQISKPSSKEGIKPVNFELELKLSKISDDLNLLKKQMNSLKKEGESDKNLPSSREVKDSPESFQSVMETRKEISKLAQEKTLSTYETALTEGKDDRDWSGDISTKINNFISSNEMGDNVYLQSVECRTSLCKIHLSYSNKTRLSSKSLVRTFGNVSVYSYKIRNASPGQDESVLYISREGGELPRSLSEN